MTFPSFHCLHLLFTFLTEPHSPPLSHPLCTPPLFPTDSDNHLFPLILFYMVSFTSSYKMSLFLCHLISAFTPLYQLSLSHFRNSTTQQMWTCCRWTQRGCLFCLPQQCRSSSWKCSHGEQAAASCMWTRWMWSTGGSLPPGCSVSTSTGLCCPRYESFFFCCCCYYIFICTYISPITDQAYMVLANMILDSVLTASFFLHFSKGVIWWTAFLKVHLTLNNGSPRVTFCAHWTTLVVSRVSWTFPSPL